MKQTHPLPPQLHQSQLRLLKPAKKARNHPLFGHILVYP
jgi:hypothetical protein